MPQKSGPSKPAKEGGGGGSGGEGTQQPPAKGGGKSEKKKARALRVAAAQAAAGGTTAGGPTSGQPSASEAKKASTSEPNPANVPVSAPAVATSVTSKGDAVKPSSGAETKPAAAPGAKSVTSTTDSGVEKKKPQPKIPTQAASKPEKVKPSKQQQPAAAKKPATNAKPKAQPKEVSQKEEVFQAVLLADNFGSSIFGPDSPLVQEGLIPLVNRSLIDYSLESLTVSGVQEIFIYCSTDVDGIREHIRNSKWSAVPDCTIKIIVSEDSLSLGDALRDIDGKGVIKNDFILLSAGVVTNLPLKPLLNYHKDIVKVDRGAVMTLVHRKMQPDHRSRPRNQNTAVVLNSSTKKIIAYDHKPTGRRLCIPLESIQDEMDVFMDTVDTGIAICSASVPPLFTDNFDFTCINDFVRGIMINEEILGNSLYLLRVESGYANRVVDFDTYHGISCDILQRWTYPVVPDMPFGSSPNDSVYSMGKNFTYKAPNVKVAYGTEIGKSVIIGANTVIQKGSKITGSVLGSKCKIGENVNITKCHFGNNVEIKAGCKLNRCVLMDNTVWKDDALIEDMLIVNGEKIPVQDPAAAAAEDDSESGTCSCKDSGDDDFVLGGSDDDFGESGGLQDEDYNIFSTEVLESLIRGVHENVATENLVLEINSSKYAYNMSFKEVTFALSKGMLSLPPKIYSDFHEQFSVKIQLEKTKEVIMKLKDLFVHYVKTAVSQKDLLSAIEEFANDNMYFRPMLVHILHLLYDEDILSEDSIVAWHSADSLYEAGADLRVLVQNFVDWLNASDSDDSED